MLQSANSSVEPKSARALLRSPRGAAQAAPLRARVFRVSVAKSVTLCQSLTRARTELGGAMSMPTIRVDEDVYEHLKREAEPFVDTPNSVLRRVLELDALPEAEAEQDETRADRMRPGDLLDRKVYDLRILKVLDSMGGSGYAPDVV
jgi:uncharacterized protein (DUF4415 family)